MKKDSMMIGPRNAVSQQLHASKYRQKGESFDDYCVRYARTTADDECHFRKLLECLRTQATLPAGRQQRAVGWPFQTTAFNCFVGATIPDDTRSIGSALVDAMLVLRSGGGCGWDFSTLRPQGEPVRGLGDDAYASGPVSFMGMWQAMCDTIRSAGERRGAMMGVLRVDHPDIMTFIRAKQDQKALTNFNMSVGVTSEFMEAVQADKLFPLRFDGKVIRTVRALDLWSLTMENNWDWAEPGVLFLDTINRMNPLRYLEWIAATNPCGEQPLPPDGACLLLSQNMVKYLVPSYARNVRGGDGASVRSKFELDLDRFRHDVEVSVRACDNVFENTVYPLPAQAKEAMDKRRMGVGVTGLANALEVCGYRYGTPEYVEQQDKILEILRDTAYLTSIDMATVKGSFPLFDAEKWLSSGYAQTLPDHIRHCIRKHGLRNGLLLSIAPTGTISLTADNVSSGIEPPPEIEAERIIQTADGPRAFGINDWAYEEHGVRCRTALQCTPQEHVDVLCAAQKYIDSAISKTMNFRGAKQTPAKEGEITFDQFKGVYMDVYKRQGKGCTTFNINGKRMGIIKERTAAPSAEPDDTLCVIDHINGNRVCG